jgi:hypothetical protein
VLIDELLVVGNYGLGDGLTNGVDLGSVSTTGDSDADVDHGELVETDDQEGFVDLESQDLGLDEVERLSVDLDESLSCLISILSVSLPPSVCSYRSYLAVGDGGSYSKIVSTSLSSAIGNPAYLSSSCRSIAHSGLSRP